MVLEKATSGRLHNPDQSSMRYGAFLHQPTTTTTKQALFA